MLVYNYMFRLCTSGSSGRHRFAKRINGPEGSPNKQWCKIVITVNSGNCYCEKQNNNIKNYTGNLPAIVQCIGLNIKLQCKIK